MSTQLSSVHRLAAGQSCGPVRVNESVERLLQRGSARRPILQFRLNRVASRALALYDRSVRRYPYHRVDVFTDRPFGGNPLAVFTDTEGLSDAEMQLVAREMNLSETVFCVPSSTAELGLRIFTIDRELPLAGHPTVGAMWLLAQLGVFDLQRPATTVRVELGVGVIDVEVLVDEQGRPGDAVMTQRNPSFGPVVEDLDLVAQALGLDRLQLDAADLPARVVDTGVPWLLIPVRDLQALRSIAPDRAACERLTQMVGTDLVHAFTQDTVGVEAAVHTRHVWFGTVTPGEDPVTGSACGCIGAYLVHEGVLLAAPTAELVIEQGMVVGRPGHVRATVTVDPQAGGIRAVRVGGGGVVMGQGELVIPDLGLDG